MVEENEQELWRGTYSTKALMGSYVGSGLLFVLGAIVVLLCPIGWELRLGLVGLAGLPGVYCLLLGQYRKFTIRYVLTTRRMMCEFGLVQFSVSRVALVIVDDVGWKQTGLDRLFGIGTIIIQSKDLSDPTLTLIGVDGVRDVAQKLELACAAERRRVGLVNTL